MKTATIDIYKMYGTNNAFCADIYYKGKLIHSIEGLGQSNIVSASSTWIKKQGFTNVKYKA